MFLVTEHNHNDDRYQLYADCDDAFDRVKALVSSYAKAYGHDVEIHENDNWICYQGEERWHITCETIELETPATQD